MTDTFFGHVIDGEEVASLDGATFEVWNPWTQQVWAQAAEGGPQDASRAVASARTAFDEGPWPRLGRAERAAAIHRLADLMQARSDELAALLSQRLEAALAATDDPAERSRLVLQVVQLGERLANRGKLGAQLQRNPTLGLGLHLLFVQLIAVLGLCQCLERRLPPALQLQRDQAVARYRDLTT